MSREPEVGPGSGELNRLDIAALVLGMAGLLLVLGVYFWTPLRSWTLTGATPRSRHVEIEILPSPGYERLLPILAGREQKSIHGDARVLAIDVAAGTARLEVQAREEPGGRLQYGGRWLRAGETVVFHDDAIYFVGIALVVGRPR